MKTQKGFAAQGAVLLAIVVVAVVAGGYVVLSRQSSSDEPSTLSTPKTAELEVDGTPENAINEVNQQISEEIANDVSALDVEDRDTEVDAAAIDELEGAIDETNL